MKRRISVHGYFDNRGNAKHGTPGREPLVHIIFNAGDGSDLQSISFPPAFAEHFSDLIKAAARHANTNSQDEDFSSTFSWGRMTPEDLDARAARMRAENADAFESIFDAMRLAGTLIEFSRVEWDAYNAKHFGRDCKISIGDPPAIETGWKDPHRLDPYDFDPDL